MKTAHCVFDNTVHVHCEVISIRTGTLEYNEYDGARQIVCKKPDECSKCGWNPEVEKKRKEKLWKRGMQK